MKTTVIENFLTEDELFDIEKGFRASTDTKLWLEPILWLPGAQAQALYCYPGPSYKSNLCNFINEKVNKLFGENECDNWHILNGYRPYGIHTDSLDDIVDAHIHSLPNGYKFGWTFLIPLDNYDTNTIVFNEGSAKTKLSNNWIAHESRVPQHSISKYIYQQYLTHESEELISFFSVDTIFPWKKGNLLAMPRTSFHCSDNFTLKKIFEKRALIGWSLLPA